MNITFTRRHLIVVAIIGAFLGWWLNPARAYAHQPYGGCVEAWQAPRSDGADHCRSHGWTVRKRLVVNPHAVVKYDALPQCVYEDGPGICVWNGKVQGNRSGPQLWIDAKERVHFVWLRSPVNQNWKWVDSGLADALAESETKGATTRAWTQCVVRYGDTTVVRCPDGLTVTS